MWGTILSNKNIEIFKKYIKIYDGKRQHFKIWLRKKIIKSWSNLEKSKIIKNKMKKIEKFEIYDEEMWKLDNFELENSAHF